MFRVNANVRTVWVKELQIEKRQGVNGEFESKSILFRVATPRNYVRTTVKDGKQVEERPTDFMLCRATGNVAQIIADNCSAVNEEGKLISRHLAVYGHIETFPQERVFKIENYEVDVEGETYVFDIETPPQKIDGHILIVNEIEFLDPNPVKKNETNNSNNNSGKGPVKAVKKATKANQTAQQATSKTTQQQSGPTMEHPKQAEEVLEDMQVPEGFTGDTGCPF